MGRARAPYRTFADRYGMSFDEACASAHPQMTISRTREYAADNLGARICGNPEWLASALAKIDASAHEIENDSAERNPATAPLFIINPLSGRGIDNLFSTHPSTENRIAALEQLAEKMGVPHYSRDGLAHSTTGP